jgi:hypothetical protein
MNNTMLKLAPEALSSARTIGDLATPESCLVALKIATVQIAARIGLSCHSAIKSSVPVYRAFHLTLQQARARLRSHNSPIEQLVGFTKLANTRNTA